MTKRHTLPRLWLMTDERMGRALFASIEALPKGAGIIFRHYSLAQKERRALFEKTRRIAERKRHVLLLGGSAREARAWRADGNHSRHGRATSAPVHSIRERVAAERRGAKLLFVSPVFSTSSHPGARPLGRVRFGIIVRGAKRPIIALGGMTQHRARGLIKFKIYGWAAISSLLC
jgi:thiamine-phosphate pyrophosphorylase